MNPTFHVTCVEQLIMLAALQEDREQVDRFLNNMSLPEIRSLENAIELISERANRWRKRQDD